MKTATIFGLFMMAIAFGGSVKAEMLTRQIPSSVEIQGIGNQNVVVTPADSCALAEPKDFSEDGNLSQQLIQKLGSVDLAKCGSALIASIPNTYLYCCKKIWND